MQVCQAITTRNALKYKLCVHNSKSYKDFYNGRILQLYIYRHICIACQFLLQAKRVVVCTGLTMLSVLEFEPPLPEYVKEVSFVWGVIKRLPVTFLAPKPPDQY